MNENTATETYTGGTERVPPLNMTAEERRTLIHCIIAGEEAAVEHFGEDEAERIVSIKEKIDCPVRGKYHSVDTDTDRSESDQ